MLLKRLVEYSDRLESRPTLYGEAAVRYIVELDSEGRLLTRDAVDTATNANARTKRGERRLMPQIQRSVGIKPILFADKASYTLGLSDGEAKSARAKQCHEAYMELLRRCAQRVDLKEVNAVLRFLEGEEVGKLRLRKDAEPGDTMTFRVDGVFPSDLPAVQRFWADEHDPANANGGEAHRMQCIVCGETRPVLPRLQAKIKGIPGGQTSGTAIISANAGAFESYGLKASLVAPTCARCGERFTRAANHLLSVESGHIAIAGAVFIFWTRDPEAEFSFRDFLDDPRPEQVRALIESARTGRRAADFRDSAFYAAALSASGGRVVVRDWIDTTVSQVQRNLARWFERQRITDAYGGEPRPFGITALAGATVRKLRDLAPPVSRALLRAALTGAPPPFDLLYEGVRRNRAEQGITHARAALIKLVITSQQRDVREEKMVALDSENNNPAYLCGRLLAVLEQAQRLAIPGIGAGATIVSRFFGTASSAPLSVFPRLLRGAQAHLGKLERDRRGAYLALQRRMEDIMGGIAGFPATLTLEEQGLFSLGYYHQRAHDRAQAKTAKAERDAQAAETEITEEN